MSARGSYYPAGANVYVPNMAYAADVQVEGQLPVDLTPAIALRAAVTNGILAAQSIATAGTATTFVTAFAAGQNNDESFMGRFGRNLTVVASGAATSNVTVYGADYLGQPMAESFTLNGATPVVGKKAFRRLTSIVYGATAATTIDVGYGNVLGLPYAYIGEGQSYTDDVLNASQGTFVARVATQTTTSGDPRGTWTPAAGDVPNGTKRHKVHYQPLGGNLYGARHVTA
jgi:hypothetical protein